MAILRREPGGQNDRMIFLVENYTEDYPKKLKRSKAYKHSNPYYYRYL
ncbi:MAG: hypothetical protein J6Y41_01850 [Bacteroidaceae bacterium]|nr:hypothetical protein [Bacteroidaceae bacterium]